MKIKFCAIILVFVFILSLCSCKNNDNKSQLFFAKKDVNYNAENINFSERSIIAENNYLKMYFDPNLFIIDLAEKSTDRILWSSGIRKEEYPVEIKNKLTESAIKELVNLKYTDFAQKVAIINNFDSKCKTEVCSIKNGIRFNFDFSNISIKFSIDITLTPTGIRAYIPKKSIVEDGEFGITSIDILPMFGACSDTDNGYMFVPDGCGAIYNFGKTNSENDTLNFDIYDKSLMDIDDEKDDLENGIKKVSIPVFGVVNQTNNTSLFANITDGEENCSLTLQNSHGTYALNRTFATVKCRKQYLINTSSGDTVSVYEKENNISDLSIDYSILCGENIGYDAMANCYREYLIENGYLKKMQDSTVCPIQIDFLMSIKTNSSFLNQIVVTSDSIDVADMISYFNNNGIKKVDSLLLGWNSNGYASYPTKNSLSKKIGDKKDFKTLLDNDTVNFYLSSNFFKANINEKGFSKYTDVVYKVSKIPLTDESEEEFLLNPLTQQKKFDKYVSFCNSFDVGMALEDFGNILYEDFETSRRLTRSSFKKTLTDMLKGANVKHVAIDGFNPYTVKYADLIYNLPENSSDYSVMDDDVPFLQIVLHGCVDYSSEISANLSDDLTFTKLKWIEYGYIPSFIITKKNSDKIQDTNFNVLFSSDYNLWKDKIVEFYKEFNEKMSVTYGQKIVLHNTFDNCAVTKYENGVCTVVNYSDNDILYENHTVNAKDYIVLN